MEKSYFEGPRVRNVVPTGNKCPVCEKGDETEFEVFV
jgi:hypothetical protein